MKVSVFGLGYVGAVTAGCLAEAGHTIIGVDVQPSKVGSFNAGTSPIIEPELDNLLRTAKLEGRLSATTSAEEAVGNSDVSIVCVGTPSAPSGRLNLDYVRKVTHQISDAVRASQKKHVIIFRSTMLPGSTRGLAADYLTDLKSGGLMRVYYCPEFLREGTAVADFRNPSLAVIGTNDGADPATGVAEQLFGGHPSVLKWEGAEMIKYACNYFHALKVGFANEIGRLCKHIGEDGSRVMDVVCQDTRLNISRYYMRPGNPFGGSCLPKDVSALASVARRDGVSLPLLDSTLGTNQAHLDLLVQLIVSKEKRKIGLLGLAFKADTDDLRGSPMVALAETLLGRGYELRIFDPQLNLSRLIGSNEEEIRRRMPHLSSLLMDSAADVVRESEVIVASQKCSSISELTSVVRAGQLVIDVNGWREIESLPWTYEGLCW